MGSRKDLGGTDQCLDLIRGAQKKILEVPFASNYLAVQQKLDETRECNTQVKALKRKVNEVKHLKGQTPEGQKVVGEYSVLEDQALQKKRCLETLFYVTEVENLLQNVQSDFEERAMYLTERKLVFDSMHREEALKVSSRMHRDCVYAMRATWSWLGQVTQCLEVHMKNAGEYHQFFHEVQFIHEDMQTFLGLLNNSKMRAYLQPTKPDIMIQYFKDITNRLLDYQARVEDLGQRSTLVHPIYLRKDPPVYPLRAKCLVEYSNQEISLSPGDACIVLDNSDADKWQIRKSDGTEADVPGVVLVIPPPDRKAIHENQKLKDQLVINWDTTLKRLCTQLTQYFTNSIKETPSIDMKSLSAPQKAELMKLMNEAVQILRPVTHDDKNFQDLMSSVTNFRKILSQFKPGDKDARNISVQKWQTNGKVMLLYKDFLTYGKSYKDNVSSSRGQEKLMVNTEQGHMFQSKAYFERVLPIIDVDVNSKEAILTNFKADMIINERHNAKCPVPPPRRKRQSRQASLVPSSGENLRDLQDFMEEIKPFTILGVIDPKSKQKLSVFQAMSQGMLDLSQGTFKNPSTGEVMTIPEAIHKGFILADFSENLTNGDSHDGFNPMRNTLDTRVYPVSGVIDPRTGEWIGVRQAVNAGILNPKTGKYRNIVTGEEVDFLEAIQNGYLVVDPSAVGDLSENGVYTFVDLVDASFKVNGVIDPNSGEEISLKRAIMDGVVDITNSVYRNPNTGETMSLEEALKQGLIKAQPATDADVEKGVDIITIKQLQVKRQKFVPGDDKMSGGLDNIDGWKPDQNQLMFNKVRTLLDPDSVTVIDPSDNSSMTLTEAFEKGVINFAKGEFHLPNGEVLTLEQAAARNFIDPAVLKDLLEVYNQSSLGDLCKQGKFDPETGLVTDPQTGTTMSLESAIAQKLVDPNQIFIYDVPSQKLMSLQQAVDEGKYNLSAGKYVHPKTGELLTLTEAEKAGIVKCSIDPEERCKVAKTLERLNKLMDTTVKSAPSPFSDGKMSLEEAIQTGVIDLQKGQFTDPVTGEVMTLADAIKEQKLDPAAASHLIKALDKLSLREMMEDLNYDPETGLLAPGNSSRPISMEEALKQGLICPENVFLVDKVNGRITTLGNLIDEGRFDPKDGTYINPNTGEKLTLAEAIEQGLIEPSIIEEDFIDTSVTLKDLIDSGKVNPRSTHFVAPNNVKMSLRDALANGFLTLNSKVKLDPRSGCVQLASDEEVVKALLDVRESSDWLQTVEQTLGTNDKASQKLENLKQQTEDYQVLQDDISKHEDEVKTSIKQAEELIENNRTVDKKDDGAQQLQKLKFNTADLKVRFNDASTETEGRCRRFEKMSADLEDFYGNLQDLDQWLDQAIELSEEYQASDEDIEVQFSNYKEFVDELQAKETEMANAFKIADGFRDEAQEFEKEAEAYRQRTHQLPPIREEHDNDVIDDEIESLEAKYRDISRECSKHLEKLSSIMKQKKAFDELSDKLSGVYPQIEKKVAQIDEQEVGKMPDRDTQDLAMLKDLKADLIGQERKLKELSQTGEKLVKGLEGINMQSKADTVRNTMDECREKHDSLQRDIALKEEVFDSAVSQQHDVMNRLDELTEWLSETEQFLNEGRAISLDKDKLLTHLKEQQLMNAEIDSNKALLERLSEAPDTSMTEDAETAIFDLSERVTDVERKAELATKGLEEIASRMSDLDSGVSQMEGWLTESIDLLKNKSRGSNQKAIKAKVDVLYNEKREREIDMENIRGAAKSIMDDDRVCDEFAVKESLGEVESKWHELTEHLVQQVSLEALTEIEGMLRYLDKAENDINTAEAISIDPEILTVQLKDHHSFNDDLNQKRNAVKEIINKCNRMLRETTNSQTDEIKSRLDSIRAQADIVCQLSSERLGQLEAALPLATHFSENQSEIQSWLDEMEADMKAQSSPGESLDQIKKQYENIKGSQQKVDDHKPFIDDLNTTGLELMELCGDSDAGEIQTKLLSHNDRYAKLKSLSRQKAKDMIDAKSNMTQEVGEMLDNLLDDLSQINRNLTTANPIPANPDKLRDDQQENKLLLEDLERYRPMIVKAEDDAKKMLMTGMEDDAEEEDLKQKVTEIATLNNQIRDQAQRRDQELDDALQVAEKFHDLCSETMSNLRDLKDNLLSQEPPGVDSPTVQEQQKELKELRKELGKARLSLEECRQSGDQLSGMVGEPGLVEVRKQLEDLHNLADDVHDITREREEDLKTALSHTDKFQELVDSINSWLPLSEHKLANMKPVSTNPETLCKQMEEIKDFAGYMYNESQGFYKSQVHPHVAELQQLNQELGALKEMSPVAAEVLHKPVEDINTKWKEVLKGISERENRINQMQMKLGEVESGMDSAIKSLEQAQEDLDNFDEFVGDPKTLETHMKKLQEMKHNNIKDSDVQWMEAKLKLVQLLNRDLKLQERVCKQLSDAVDSIIEKEDEDSPILVEKRDTMNDLLRSAQANAKDKESKVHENLRQMKKYLGDVDDMLQWVTDLKTELKSSPPLGALPETAKIEYDKSMKRQEDLLNKDEPIAALIAKGEDIISKCDPTESLQIAEKLRKLKERTADTKNRAEKRKEKLNEHMQNVDEFHGTLKSFTDWLNTAEVAMRGFKYPSKLVEKVTLQIDEHEKLRAELEQQSEKMMSLDRTGSYLKYFGRKQDTIYIKNLLIGIRLRWKKLLRRTDERGRLLQQAYREDKRFYDAWKSLCDWLDDSSKLMAKFSNPQGATKQNIDELKKFQHQLAGKHPSFYSATRLGRNLKDRCTKTDPERDVLQQMVDDLKHKWNSVRSVISKSQNKLDEALLTSGRVADALTSLLEWLNKAEATLAEDQPVLGDLDTINMLVEQHKAMQQELGAREQTVAAMKAAGNVSTAALDELETTWDRVNNLSDIREAKLRDSLKMAEEFQEVVQVMREFLPQAESELKYKTLPEDEMQIIQLIEKHEKFQEELRNHQECVDKIRVLAEEILLNCHPNAIRFVKYYLTITQTRWDQLLQRAKTKEERLQDALRNIQGNAALVEELLAWMSEAYILLSTKERDPIPDDLNTVETLYKEHVEFHDDIGSKNGDVERLTKIIVAEPKSPGRHYGSNMKLNEYDPGYNPRVLTLQNKWRVVWRMSLDRKKNLQDALDNLLELESFKNFDFNVWKQRYLNWIKVKKMRTTDFFRRQDKDGDGYLSRDEFVDGMLQSGFTTNKTELNAVFDIFDKDNKYYMQYSEFIEALKPDRHQKTRLKSGKKQMTDGELIQDQIEKDVSQCQCRNPFNAQRMSEGKYRFGEKQNIRLVRFLNSTVMVRVGGGWVTLNEFLETNDPCRSKGRTNNELRDSLQANGQPEGFRSRRGSGTFGYKSKLNDTGYASSVSSAGSSGDQSLRRSKNATSMVNLSGVGSLSVRTTLRKNPDFGSTGSLQRTKRLSNSSSNIHSTPPRTPRTNLNNSYNSRSPNIQRSTTPQPIPTYTARARTPTPRTSSTSRYPPPPPPKTSTPTRSGRTTPTFSGGRTTPSGRTTPTSMTNGMSGATRRLPTTPKNPR
ncbi:microtubule-actin cross-linking factor 1, isoforms 6/7-like isoform X5 [Mytilus galloprovincialis]|uniref:microtubule-actin cross-linking factor 1, isoforms 6/7-like isoform X5 n=1 Tax=Mytilus galloprovincialis TaxID=29158 RepID=UPI003F7B60AB